MNSPSGTEETPEPVGHSECSGHALDHTRCSKRAQMTIKATAEAGAYGRPFLPKISSLLLQHTSKGD